jgi:hypothetical protein
MRGIDELTRAELAVLGREYMLFGHLLNRAALPHVHLQVGAEAREAVAIEEWMGASPIYTRRMQQRLGFAGDDVATIFKGFQLDVGFPHQYMDVRYRLESATRGAFWLQRCGALLEVEPYGEAAVRSMCHAIEDPTFDASAVATNPRARCRPVHRPPRAPADRTPHCHWEVFIDPDAEPIEEAEITRRVRRSRLALVELPEPSSDGSGGRDDYRGPFDPDFRLDVLSRAALEQACREFLVQNHLLVRALMLAVADRAGDAVARDIATRQWIGAGAVTAGRLRAALGVDGDGIDAILAMLRLHPAFLPGYGGVGLRRDGQQGRIWLEECDAVREGDSYSWSALLAAGPHPALDAMVQAVNPRARCVPAPPAGRERLAWHVVIDPAAAPAECPPEVMMVAATGTAGFAFRAPAGPV